MLRLFLVALALRLAAIAYFGDQATFDDDRRNYDRYARGWLAGEPFMSRNGVEVSERMPLYVLFLSACYGFFSDHPLSVQIPQALIGAAAVLFAPGLFRRMGAGDRAARWAEILGRRQGGRCCGSA